MTLRDLVEISGVIVEGNVTIRHWDEEMEDNVVHMQGTVMDGIFPDIDDAVMDAELKYMFVLDGALVFEIEAPEKELGR